MCSGSQIKEQTPRRVGLSLGSNKGDRLALIESACDRLCEVLGDLRVSLLYETEPVDCPPGSPAYLNACVEALTPLPPQEILRSCQSIERELGRTRSGVYGEARTCDIDLLYCGDCVLNTPELTLPHPRAHLRRFVLQPLSDIDRFLVLPGQTRSVAELLAQLPTEPRVIPFDL